MDNSKAEKGPPLTFHLYTLPIYMAVGSSGLLTTLIALSLGASVAEIGLMTGAGAAVTIVFSTLWGRLSDLSGMRRRYLLFFFVGLGPIFIVMNIATVMLQLILLYTLLAVFTSGITPVATMYSVENCKAKNWQAEVARYNSLSILGAILGLSVNTIIALFLKTSWLFYVSAAMCFVAALILWKTGKEPEMTFERHFFPVKFHDVERLLSPKLFFHYLRMKWFRIPRNPKKLKPLQLLFLGCLVHWMGVSFWAVGHIPLLKTLGLSDSMQLAIVAATNAAAAISFVKLMPHIKSGQKRAFRIAMISRGALIICWATLPVFLVYPVSFVFVFPLLLSFIFDVLYPVVWLPVTAFAISQASAGGGGAAEGQLLSVHALAIAVGSALGGIVITACGYTVGFAVAGVLSMLALPIFSRIDII
jgi:predicted MFS family arabinose efflux permease